MIGRTSFLLGMPIFRVELLNFWGVLVQVAGSTKRKPGYKISESHSVRRQLIMAGFPASDLPREETHWPLCWTSFFGIGVGHMIPEHNKIMQNTFWGGLGFNHHLLCFFWCGLQWHLPWSSLIDIQFGMIILSFPKGPWNSSVQRRRHPNTGSLSLDVMTGSPQKTYHPNAASSPPKAMTDLVYKVDPC